MYYTRIIRQLQSYCMLRLQIKIPFLVMEMKFKFRAGGAGIGAFSESEDTLIRYCFSLKLGRGDCQSQHPSRTTLLVQMLRRCDHVLENLRLRCECE